MKTPDLKQKNKGLNSENIWDSTKAVVIEKLIGKSHLILGIDKKIRGLDIWERRKQEAKCNQKGDNFKTWWTNIINKVVFKFNTC